MPLVALLLGAGSVVKRKTPLRSHLGPCRHTHRPSGVLSFGGQGQGRTSLTPRCAFGARLPLGGHGAVPSFRPFGGPIRAAARGSRVPLVAHVCTFTAPVASSRSRTRPGPFLARPAVRQWRQVTAGGQERCIVPYVVAGLLRTPSRLLRLTTPFDLTPLAAVGPSLAPVRPPQWRPPSGTGQGLRQSPRGAPVAPGHHRGHGAHRSHWSGSQARTSGPQFNRSLFGSNSASAERKQAGPGCSAARVDEEVSRSSHSRAAQDPFGGAAQARGCRQT